MGFKPRRRPGGRNYVDPQYTAWRAAVRKRDGHKCRKCGSKKSLQCHHIRRWADFPQLRYAVSNGISLCRRCHDAMSGNEELYAALCLTLLRRV